jgi:hypothetical protein
MSAAIGTWWILNEVQPRLPFGKALNRGRTQKSSLDGRVSCFSSHSSRLKHISIDAALRQWIQGTRRRILAAARQVLAQGSEEALSMETIARVADVSRLTGGMQHMREVFREPDPSAALDKFVGIFVAFWSSDRIVIRRLRAMAALDPEIQEGIHSRDARRRHVAREILKRMAAAGKEKHTEAHLSTAADVIATLAGFATYDALATARHDENEIIAIIARLAHLALG